MHELTEADDVPSFFTNATDARRAFKPYPKLNDLYKTYKVKITIEEVS